jgi:hypothetical protein
MFKKLKISEVQNPIISPLKVIGKMYGDKCIPLANKWLIANGKTKIPSIHTHRNSLPPRSKLLFVLQAFNKLNKQ